MSKFIASKTRIAISFCIGLLYLTHPAGLLAGDIDLDAKVTRNKIQIADPFELEIRITAPAGTQVSFPPIEETLGPFEVLTIEDTPNLPLTNQNSNQRLWQRTISLETLESGQLEVPMIEVAVKQFDQPAQVLRTKPIPIEVTSTVEPSADLTKFKGLADAHDLNAPMPEPYRWIWFMGGVAAIAIGMAASALFLTTRRTPTVSAKAWALQKLNETRNSTAADTIVRQYIQDRFDFSATSLPVTKTISELQMRGVEKSLLLETKDLIQKSEQAKFGGRDLSSAEADRLRSVATRIIENLDPTGEPN